MDTGSGYQAVLDDSNTPLFGDSSADTSRGRLINILVGFITSFVVFFTMISALIYDKNTSRGLNITFALVIVIICLSHLLLILWYRQGGVEAKFKTLIYVNAFYITALCIIANIYFHG